jgi:glycogen operon protein
MVPQLARRIGGSLDLFANKRNPARSINFITAHDGFTLRDLVSYREKHNLQNGEGNRDGAWENFSTNLGVEGETSDPNIRSLRRRLAKNLLTILLTARGTPMLLGGDELWRTQQGNNNTYCQDNELSWFDWTPNPESDEMQRFLRMLVDLRRKHPALKRPGFVDPFAIGGAGVSGPVGSDITWHGVQLYRPDWSYHSYSLALQIHGPAPTIAPESTDNDFYLMFNAWSQPLEFQLPPLPAPLLWHRLVDTFLPSPHDIMEENESVALPIQRYLVCEHSTVVLFARPPIS